MDATYRTLRAAADLKGFTIADLVHASGVNERTVRTAINRNSHYFELDEDPPDLLRRRGGQVRFWKVRADKREELEDALASTVSGMERREHGQLRVDETGELTSKTRLTLRAPGDAPERLTADELHDGLLMAEIDLLPQLLERLLVATPGLSGLSLRTREGTLMPSYDGLVGSPVGTPPYVPAGPSVWELGAGGDPRDKANRDLATRTDEPGQHVVPSRCAFVFVTTRRFPDKETWPGNPERAKAWRTFRIIDANDLHLWMLAHPAVHIWASERVGLHPLEVSTLERWFPTWCRRTNPPIPPTLLLAGRDREVQLVRAAATGPAQDFGLYANSREEALAFIAAALLDPSTAGSEHESRFRSALLVETPQEWARLVGSLDDGVLIPHFSDPDVASALARNLTVLLPMGLGEVEHRSNVRLGRLDLIRASEILRSEKHAFAEAERIATEVDRSLTSFRRRYALSRSGSMPSWVKDHGKLLAPLVLIGSWEARSAADQRIVATITKRDYEEVEVELKALASEEDPPFFESGGCWQLSSPEDAFDLLGNVLTDAVLRRWEDATVEVLGEIDPRIAMTPDEPIFVVSKEQMTYSSALRQGLARGTALLGAFGPQGLGAA